MFKLLISTSLKTKILAGSILSILLINCQPEKAKQEVLVDDTVIENPAAPGFDSLNSDQKAIEWADATMKAMGGRAKWDATRFISWNFFGRRDLIWDKHTGDVRIESPSDSIIFLLNIKNGKGKVQLKGREILDADSVSNFLDRGKRIWINDSYWLVMPFKLKDSGVTLKYLQEDTVVSGEPAHKLGLTFKEVGVTPNNKYEIYITKSDSLVKQWAYFSNAEQDSASAIWPWDNYKVYNGLLLSADRSDGLGPKNVTVSETISDGAFTDFDWQ